MNLLRVVRTVAKYLLRPVRPFPDDYLRHVTGVIHIGANSGQERHLYGSREVIWVEAIPALAEELRRNIADFPTHRAINTVLSERDGDVVEFHVASNDGLSSSMLDFKVHADDRPDIKYVDTLKLTTMTFRSMVGQHGIDLDRFGGLVIDVQGAEMLVLKGAGDLVRQFKFIKAEASDAELYAGACLADELIAYLAAYGFRVQRKIVIAVSGNGKRTYDIIFRRVSAR